MPEHSSYDYAVIRVVPHVERGECINVGVLLFCRTRNFLGALIQPDPHRLLVLAPDLDLTAVREQLDMITLTCEGSPETGNIGRMSLSERFHWLVSPKSTIIQTSEVHCGICHDPAVALQHLLHKLVAVSVPSRG
jgi:hypothetical protein